MFKNSAFEGGRFLPHLYLCAFFFHQTPKDLLLGRNNGTTIPLTLYHPPPSFAEIHDDKPSIPIENVHFPFGVVVRGISNLFPQVLLRKVAHGEERIEVVNYDDIYSISIKVTRQACILHLR